MGTFILGASIAVGIMVIASAIMLWSLGEELEIW